MVGILTSDNKFVNISGRILPRECIISDYNYKYDCRIDGNWSGELKNVQMFISFEIKSWIIFIPSSFIKCTHVFLNSLIMIPTRMEFILS